MLLKNGLYKNILNNVPSAIIVVDRKYRARFANSAFTRFFMAGERKNKTLADCINCVNRGSKCGGCKECAYCRFKQLFDVVFKTDNPITGNVTVDMPFGDRTRKIAIRMNVKKLSENYCMGIIDGAYESEIMKELSSAAGIQQRLLPAGKAVGGVKYKYMFIPCRDIGGDLPDVYDVNGDTFGFLADVSGKGISAGMLSAFVKAGFDRSEPSPARAIAKLNDKFKDLNMDETSYITVAAVRIDSENKTVHYSTAGHNAPILLKSGFDVSEIVLPSPPVSTWFENAEYDERQVSFKKGDVLVLLTDGVTESKNRRGEMFGVDRVETILLKSADADDFIERLKNELKAFCGEFDDDITAIAFDL